ncbi:MCE family protein [Actinomadura atramentaria]|uniref:MCE family protein n=1 Tax=Actinomadura atramentaria TaxID=1990 RepID=UPI00039D59E2|nr:MCE family protein [Actinomadura atramentaria]
MTRRLTINLAVFATLAVVMVVWAFRNVVHFDFIERPYHLVVEFESSPGLHPGFEVDYLGLRIGKIDSVKLEKDRVVVRLDIDRGVTVPQGVKAAAARKSAVGEPVVELTPGPGGINAPAMKAGTVIPKSQTSVPPKYGDLFAAVIDSLKAINPNDAKMLTHELAAGWSGREDSLRQIINGGDQLTATFAQNTELLDRLTKEFGRIGGVLNANRGDLGAGIDNLAAVTAALSQVRGQLTELRDRGPDLLATVNGLLDQTGKNFECTVDALGTLGLSKYDPDYLKDLADVLRAAPMLNTVLHNVIGNEGGKPVLNVVFLITLKTTATLEYKYPLDQPGVNKTITCPDGSTPQVGKQKPYKSKDPGATIPTHDPSVGKNDAQINAKNVASNDDDASSTVGPRWLMYVAPVLALLVLIRVIANFVPALSRLTRLPAPLRRRRKKD